MLPCMIEKVDARCEVYDEEGMGLGPMLSCILLVLWSLIVMVCCDVMHPGPCTASPFFATLFIVGSSSWTPLLLLQSSIVGERSNSCYGLAAAAGSGGGP